MTMERSTAEREHPPRNLVTNYDETVSAMGEVEGDAPAWHDMMSRAEGNTIESAMTSLNRGLEHEEDYLDEPIVNIVYGIFGINRWFVRAGGSVEFSKRHAASPEQLEKARQLGFRINE